MSELHSWIIFVRASPNGTSKKRKVEIHGGLGGKWKQPINKKAPTKEKLCDQTGSHHNENPNKK